MPAAPIRRRATAGLAGAVHDLEGYRLRPTEEEITSYVGMVIFLGSWAMMFAALLFAYAVVRARAPAWPPPDLPPLPVLLPGLDTLVIAASSVAVALGVRAHAVGRHLRAAAALAAGATLGALFLALQAGDVVEPVGPRPRPRERDLRVGLLLAHRLPRPPRAGRPRRARDPRRSCLAPARGESQRDPAVGPVLALRGGGLGRRSTRPSTSPESPEDCHGAYAARPDCRHRDHRGRLQGLPYARVRAADDARREGGLRPGLDRR